MTFTDPRDGKVYKTVQICELVWLAENLNYEAEGSVCYNNDPANGEKYGRLYSWEQAKKACPPGWHLPSDDEWVLLITSVGGYKTAGKNLKTKSGWKWNNYIKKSGNGTDKFGFSALPGGFGDSNGNFNDVGNFGSWWSFSDGNAYRRDISHSYNHVDYNVPEDGDLYSVRCVQDYAEGQEITLPKALTEDVLYAVYGTSKRRAK